MSRKTDKPNSTFLNLHKGYIKSELRHKAAALYLAIKLNNTANDKLVHRFAVRMGKQSSWCKRIIEFCQEAERTNNKATEQRKDNAEVVNDLSDLDKLFLGSIGYNGSAGIDPAGDTSDTPYTEGVTGGFSLHGAGKAYLRLALKGCGECQGLYMRRSDKVIHTTKCKNDVPGYEPEWFENPRLTEQDGRYIQLNDGMSIMANLPQEEVEMQGDHQDNGKPCNDDNHVEIRVTSINPDGSERNHIRYMVERIRKGEETLEPCPKCRGTNTAYPKCRMCDGSNVINYTEVVTTQMWDPNEGKDIDVFESKLIASQQCPSCAQDRGRNVNVTGASSDANRDHQQRLLEQVRQDAEFVDLGEDFALFASSIINVMKVGKLQKANNIKLRRRDYLVSQLKEQGWLSDEDTTELETLKEVKYFDDLDAWRTLIIEEVTLNNLQLDWLWILNGKPHPATNSSKLQAMDRILQWCLNPTGGSVAGTIGRDYDELILMLPEHSDVGDSWGPYLLQRELGDAELMEHTINDDLMHSMDIYPLNEEPQYNVIQDDVRGYNPGRDLSERAATQAETNMIEELVLPVITNPKATYEDYFAVVKLLRNDRRPRRLTVGDFLGNNPEFLNEPKDMSFLEEPMCRAHVGDQRVAGFFFGDKGFLQLRLVPNPKDVKELKDWAENNINNTNTRIKWVRAEVGKLPTKWSTKLHKHVNGVDGISCWKSANISEGGITNAFALLGAAMLKRKIVKETMNKRKHAGTAALRAAGQEERANTYNVMAMCYQWVPEGATKLPDLAYFKWETGGLMSRDWDSVPSRITQGAINTFIKGWCKENKVEWTSWKEPRGQYSVTHVVPVESKHVDAIDKAMGIWMNKVEQQRLTALDQFSERMAVMANRWRPVVTQWMQERNEVKAQLKEWNSDGASMGRRDDFDILVGNTHVGPRVYGGDNSTIQYVNNMPKNDKGIDNTELGQLVGEMIANTFMDMLMDTTPLEIPTIEWPMVKNSEASKPGSIIIYGKQ